MATETSSEVILYNSELCPFSQRVLLALNLKNISYKVEMINLKQKPEWFLKINPGGETPVLKHNEKYILESPSIIEYIDTTWNTEPLLYEDSAQTKEWVKIAEDEFRISFSKVLIASPPPMQKRIQTKVDCSHR